MTFAIKEEALHGAIETTYDTAETIVATDVLEVENLNPNPAESARIIERNIVRSSLAPQPHDYGGSLFGFSFDAELKGSGAAGTAPRVGRFLRACGMSETIVVSTSVTYQPESTTSLHDSLTLEYTEGPNLRVVTGCRGTVAVNVEAGGRIMASFQFIGHIDSETQAAGFAQTAETTTPPIFLGAAFSAGGYATPISKLAVDIGNTMSIAPNPNTSDGFGVIRIGARKIAGSFDPEAQGISTKDYIGEFRNATDIAIQTGVIGSVAGNRVAISMPRTRYMAPSSAEREALRIYEIPFGAYETVAGDDDLAIQFT